MSLLKINNYYFLLFSIFMFYLTYIYNKINLNKFKINIKVWILILLLPNFIFLYFLFIYNYFLSINPLSNEYVIFYIFMYLYVYIYIFFETTLKITNLIKQNIFKHIHTKSQVKLVENFTR